MAYADRYLLFIEYFNQAKFMSAQTTLDEIWLEETGTDKNFYGGLIQISVALYHLTNDNPKGAKKIYEKGRQLLSPYGSFYHDIDVEKLLAQLDNLFSTGIEEHKTNIDYLSQVPKIAFDHSR